MEWESDVVQSRMETHRASSLLEKAKKIDSRRKNGTEIWVLDCLLNLLCSICLSFVTLHPPGCLDPPFPVQVTFRHVCTVQWRGLCSAKMSSAAATTLTMTQKHCRSEPSTATGLFRPVKVITRHERLTVHVHVQCSLSKSGLGKVLPCC